ncbi:MAG TPA: hypothetical protein VJ045_06115 [Hyphomicrobiaceae bacterium]|nr:hypothetical protein [Hyphomicrobiaceae bacterium]
MAKIIASTDDLPLPVDDKQPWDPAGHPPANPAADPEPADDEAAELDEMLNAIAAAKDEDTEVTDGRPEWNK